MRPGLLVDGARQQTGRCMGMCLRKDEWVHNRWPLFREFLVARDFSGLYMTNSRRLGCWVHDAIAEI